MPERDDEGGGSPPIYPGPSGISGVTPTDALAPASASYVVVSASAALSSERVLTAGTRLTLTDGGSTLTLDVDANPKAYATDRMGEVADLAPVTIKASAPAGLYLLEAQLKVNSGAAVGTISAQAAYTNGGAQTATAFTGFTITVVGMQSGMVCFYHTGSDITISTTITGLVGSVNYDVHFRILNLG